MPDLTSRIRFSYVFPKKAWIILCEPTWIRSGWPCQGLAKRIWSGSKLVCSNHQARFLEGGNPRATNFLLSDSVAIIHTRRGSYCAKPARIKTSPDQNQPGSKPARIRFSSDSHVRVWPNGSAPEANPVCKNHPARFWPILPSRSG